MSSQQNSPATSAQKNLSAGDTPKTKAQIRAENRERQEKQRAAKAAATANKSPGGPSADAGGSKSAPAAKPVKQKRPTAPKQDDMRERRGSVLSNDHPQSTVADVENKIRDLRIFSHFGARGQLGQKSRAKYIHHTTRAFVR
ncbi:translation initiation factor eIF-2B delta subunit [Ceratobasidium sp. AG-Ba]|nr:translation initiation factor eIF-2B delta subunit [Ceratobasidium sp. AG-Ba]